MCVARVSPALIFQQLTVNHYESLNFPYDVGEFLRSPFMDCLAHIRAACVSTKRAPPEGHHGTPGIREGDAYFTCCQVQTHYKELRMYSSHFLFFLEGHTSWFCFVLQTASTFFPSLAALPVWCHRGSTPYTYMCMICHYFWKNVLKNYIFDNILYNSLFLDTPGIE